jgi:serine/threonine protein kinase
MAIGASPGVDLGGPLGAGSFGTVYRGRHRFLDIDVAVKLIEPSGLGAGSPSQILQEAQLMARLDHPNLLRVFDAGVVEGISISYVSSWTAGRAQIFTKSRHPTLRICRCSCS